ncbi:hypothetical protein QYM36_005936 [Artemia franciscana]|uniref:Uncharacterized protein n=1 Tax=Artemia franciscana TaxID=6661 RepID=A0AA88IBG0_ARTSF|nr:hypothetical protein QYM36_005936 [Artemia franciscana]
MVRTYLFPVADIGSQPPEPRCAIDIKSPTHIIKDLVGDLKSLALRPILDFSNWDPIKYPYLVNSQTKNEFRRLKNELGSDTFIELIAASPKFYCVVTQNEKLKKAAKGTSKHLMKKYLTAERFKEAIFEGRVIRTTTNAIKSLKLKLYTMEVVRAAISGVSDKVYIFNDGITTLPLGHYKI